MMMMITSWLYFCDSDKNRRDLSENQSNSTLASASANGHVNTKGVWRFERRR